MPKLGMLAIYNFVQPILINIKIKIVPQIISKINLNYNFQNKKQKNFTWSYTHSKCKDAASATILPIKADIFLCNKASGMDAIAAKDEDKVMSQYFIRSLFYILKL